MRTHLVFAALVLMIGLAMSATAQDKPKDAPADAPKDAPTEPAKPAGPERKAFDEVVEQWNQLLSQMPPLRDKWQKAAAEQKPEIEKEFDAVVEKLNGLRPKLLAAAEAAYAADPADLELSQVMVDITAETLRGDRYQEGRRLAELLIGKGHKDLRLHEMAGIAAFALHDFEGAEQHFAKAKEAGTLSFQARQAYADSVPEYKDKLWPAEQKIREAEAKADNLPRVKLATSKGDIVIELFENEAPNTVASFISLVEKGFYDNVVFHRVLPNFMAQGGDPTGQGSGGPGYTIACECYAPNARMHFRGSLSMAHAGKDTGGSQFFLTFLPTAHLNGKHTVFGRIIEGLDVLEKLQRRDPSNPAAAQIDPDKIVKATVVRKREHEYKPVTKPEADKP